MSIEARLAIAAGIFAGGLATGWYLQSVETGRAKNEVEQLQGAARLAKALAEGAARTAEGTIAGLQSDLAASHRMQRIEYVEVEKQIEAVASPARQCLSPSTVRVLRGAHRPAAEGEGPREPLGSGLRLAPDPGGSGASEKAVADWMNAALDQYKALQKLNRTLVQTIRSLPCVEVVE